MSYIICVSLSFLICKMGILIELTTRGCCENEMRNFKVLEVFITWHFSSTQYMLASFIVVMHLGYFHICKVMAFVNFAIQMFKCFMFLCDFRLCWF